MAISPVNERCLWDVTGGDSILPAVTDTPNPPAPKSYLLLGPPDILYDLLNDFADDGWHCSADRWKAVITRPDGDNGPDPGAWPAEISLQGISTDGHQAACREHLSPTD
jgi:hypothetical protein